jgi:hypothetical protein
MLLLLLLLLLLLQRTSHEGWMWCAQWHQHESSAWTHLHVCLRAFLSTVLVSGINIKPSKGCGSAEMSCITVFCST